MIPGCSSIHFDEISKKKIYESIDRLSTPKKMLIDKYMQLKDKLGRIPNILEFYEYGEIDPLLFIQYSGSYHKFLQMADKSYNQSFSAARRFNVGICFAIFGKWKESTEICLYYSR